MPSSPERTRHFILGMENVTRELAPRIAELLPLAGARRLRAIVHPDDDGVQKAIQRDEIHFILLIGNQARVL